MGNLRQKYTDEEWDELVKSSSTLSPEKEKNISKYISYVLRHCPDKLDNEQGWIPITKLVDIVNAETKYTINNTDIERIVHTDDKQRYTISKDNIAIRANQGHSFDVDLGYKVVSKDELPKILYAGTAKKNLDSIRSTGLNKMSRHDVHLTESYDTAYTVGSRHGKPVVLQIDVLKMSEDGYEFRVTPNYVWLTEHVPAKYIKLIDTKEYKLWKMKVLIQKSKDI